MEPDTFTTSPHCTKVTVPAAVLPRVGSSLAVALGPDEYPAQPASEATTAADTKTV
jgi:hypothetical protein